MAGLALLGAALGLGAVSSAVAEDEAPAPAPEVQLDQLLQLPSGASYGVEKKGGLTRLEWRNRFQELHEGRRTAEEALEKAETELQEVASSAEPWQLGPPLPGMTSAEAPLDYRLRQEIRRHRSEIERIDDRLTDLLVQADLAGVPPAWRE
ncbi:MAG: hypothetical protein CL910_15690 [Deltaproteobacteria bacterium]|nr:hypothetical protein [Deltaproteobacteria bacterium]